LEAGYNRKVLNKTQPLFATASRLL
jgi:hypothetical protein